MPKRTAEARIEYYKQKIRKFEEKSKPRRRILIFSSSSESSDNEEQSDTETYAPPSAETVILQAEPDAGPLLEELQENTEVPSGDAEAHTTQETVPSLDPEIVLALGTKVGDEAQYGENIHENLAQLWSPMLKKGIPKEDKDKILKDYIIPKNCTLLQAPVLNPEISAAITESARNRDKKMQSLQQQLGSGITAVNRAIDILVGPNDDKCKTIRHLSDACRILCDLHHVNSSARTKLITPSLEKGFLNVVQDACRDETLFGNNLPEKIKASKAIVKQGLQIKKFVASGPSTSAGRPSQQRGNRTGPPRYNPGRAARGGPRNTQPHRQPYPARAAQPRPPNKPQTRARATHQ